MSDNIFNLTDADEANTVFGESEYYCVATQYQHIIYCGKIIGIVIERTKNMFTPIITSFLSNIKEVDLQYITCEYTECESEDVGYSFCYFKTLQDLINSYKNITANRQ